MADLKVLYANFMVHRVQAALADGHTFIIVCKDEEQSIHSSHVDAIAIDSGAVVVTLRRGAEAYIRYDQIVRVEVTAKKD